MFDEMKKQKWPALAHDNFSQFTSYLRRFLYQAGILCLLTSQLQTKHCQYHGVTNQCANAGSSDS